MKKYIFAILLISFVGIAGSASAAKIKDKALEKQQERLMTAVDHIERRVERFDVVDIDNELAEFRIRINAVESKEEIIAIAKDIRTFHKELQKGALHDALVASVAKKIQNHSVEVMKRRSASIAEHLIKLESQGKNIDEAEAILQNANVKIAALEGDTVQEVQKGIHEIYALFASIAKTLE